MPVACDCNHGLRCLRNSCPVLLQGTSTGIPLPVVGTRSSAIQQQLMMAVAVLLLHHLQRQIISESSGLPVS